MENLAPERADLPWKNPRMDRPDADRLAERLGWTRSPRPSTLQLLAAIASIALLGALLAWGLPWVLGTPWSEILPALAALPLLVPVGALALGAAALLAEALAVRAALPGLRLGTALQAHGAATALSLLIPGGSALGLAATWAILRRRAGHVSGALVGVLAFSAIDLVLSGIIIPVLGAASYAVLSARADLPGTWIAAVAAVLGAVLTAGGLALVLRRRTFVAVLEGITPALELLPGAGAVLRGEDDAPSPILQLRDEVVARVRERWTGLLGPLVLARVLQAGALVLAVAVVTTGGQRAAGAASASGALGSAGFPVLSCGGILALTGVLLVARTVALLPLTPGGGGLTEATTAALLAGLGLPGPQAATAALVLGLATLAAPLALGAALGLSALGRISQTPSPGA